LLFPLLPSHPLPGRTSGGKFVDFPASEYAADETRIKEEVRGLTSTQFGFISASYDGIFNIEIQKYRGFFAKISSINFNIFKGMSFVMCFRRFQRSQQA
jgi:hypothetical protein